MTSLAENNEDHYEKLRLILEKEQRRSISIEEVREVGQELICFYQLLAGDRRITGKELKKTIKSSKKKTRDRT